MTSHWPVNEEIERYKVKFSIMISSKHLVKQYLPPCWLPRESAQSLRVLTNESQVAQAPLGTVDMALRNSGIVRVCMGIQQKKGNSIILFFPLF